MDLSVVLNPSNNLQSKFQCCFPSQYVPCPPLPYWVISWLPIFLNLNLNYQIFCWLNIILSGASCCDLSTHQCFCTFHMYLHKEFVYLIKGTTILYKNRKFLFKKKYINILFMSWKINCGEEGENQKFWDNSTVQHPYTEKRQIRNKWVLLLKHQSLRRTGMTGERAAIGRKFGYSIQTLNVV
jgi:hypothetical protein